MRCFHVWFSWLVWLNFMPASLQEARERGPTTAPRLALDVAVVGPLSLASEAM